MRVHLCVCAYAEVIGFTVFRVCVFVAIRNLLSTLSSLIPRATGNKWAVDQAGGEGVIQPQVLEIHQSIA